jgi:hypothetical protein
VPTESDQVQPGEDDDRDRPWVFESYQPSIGFKFKKNPEWYETARCSTPSDHDDLTARTASRFRRVPPT